MSQEDDISKLFDKLGANPNVYREIGSVHDYFRHDKASLTRADILPFSPPMEMLTQLQHLSGELTQTAASLVPPPGALKRSVGEVCPTPSLPKVIVVASPMGGAGCTTLTAAIANGLQRQGRPALVLDPYLDPDLQTASRHHSHLSLDLSNGSAIGLLNEKGLSNRGVAGRRLVAVGENDSEQQNTLPHWLAHDTAWFTERMANLRLDGQDTVIVDVPAGNMAYLHKAMIQADVVLVVIQADVASFSALTHMDNVLASYLQSDTPPQRFYVINQLDRTHRFSLDMAEVFKTRLGDALLGTVHHDPSFSEAQAYGRDPLAPTANSIGCQDVHALCHALLECIDSDLP